jgi:hypothetical protein
MAGLASAPASPIRKVAMYTSDTREMSSHATQASRAAGRAWQQ